MALEHDSNEGVSKDEFWMVYLTWNSVFIFIQVIIFIPMILQLWKSKKDQYVDMFKLIQYITAFIALATAFLCKLLEIIFLDKAMFFSKLYRLWETNLMNFQLISLFWWFTMIVHIISYERMKDITYYNYARSRIKWWEWISAVIFTIHFFVTNIIWLTVRITNIIYQANFLLFIIFYCLTKI